MGDPREAAVVENLFRQESGRLVSALTRILGLHNLGLAEDVVQDVLCHALELWKFGGVPDNPSAWLMRAARNRAIDLIRRERTRRRFAPDLAAQLDSEWTLVPTLDALLTDHELRDDQLRMMFSCCAPSLPREAQAALILKILCGFGVAEIASAFLAGEAAVEKQLSRARRVLQRSRSLYEVSSPAQIRKRLDGVHQALYLLFNEGYHRSHGDGGVRAELCGEAIRLCALLAEHPAAGRPRTHALLALMCLHAARLPARVDEQGSLVLLEAQDRACWDGRLIALGLEALERSGAGDELSDWHVEATIAALHGTARRFEDTDWAAIHALYDRLFALRPSPIVALNRAIAVGQHLGPDAGLAALTAIEGQERLAEYPFFFAARAELLRLSGRAPEATADLRRALESARNPSEIRVLEEKLAAIASGRDRRAGG